MKLNWNPPHCAILSGLVKKITTKERNVSYPGLMVEMDVKLAYLYVFFNVSVPPTQNFYIPLEERIGIFFLLLLLLCISLSDPPPGFGKCVAGRLLRNTNSGKTKKKSIILVFLIFLNRVKGILR